MLGFLVDNTYVVTGDQVLKTRSSNNPLAFLWTLIVLLLLADLFLCSYEAEFVQNLLRDKNNKNNKDNQNKNKNKPRAVPFNHTYKFNDDILSISNQNFHNFISASYLDILLSIDSNDRLTTTYMTKVMTSILLSSTFLFYVTMNHFHLLMMCISSS
jgi:predicted DNA repair protein MutK